MQNGDFEAFGEIIKKQADYYDREIEPAVLLMYFEDLSAYSLDLIANAVKAHRNDPDRGRYFPKIADLVFFIREATTETEDQRCKRMLKFYTDRYLKEARESEEKRIKDEEETAELKKRVKAGLAVPPFTETGMWEEFKRKFPGEAKRLLREWYD